MKYQYWYARCKGGNVVKRKLLTHFGSSYAIYVATEEELRTSKAVCDAAIDKIIDDRNHWRLEEECDAFLQKGFSIVTLEMDAYPPLLKDVYDAPYALYYKGTLPTSDERCVAMVGARRPSAYGEGIAADIAAALSAAGYSIVSGLALGIDGISHHAALEAGGRTYAVLGCGVDVCYPKRHRGLYDAIIEHGAVMSEYPPETPPKSEYFPSRNRLISGLCTRTIVIEARNKSGSLITADFALEQGRDVYALPGRVTDPLSAGTNRLIAQGAAIICSKEGLLSDFLELSDAPVYMGAPYTGEKMRLEKEELLVYSCFDFYAKSITEVQLACRMELATLMAVVMRLCSYGLIRESFKNYYVRIR